MKLRDKIGAWKRPSGGTVLGAIALIVALGSVSYAAIPGSDGTISACANKKGILRVVDAEAGGTCNTKESPINWNQAGQPGQDGQPGAEGAPGISGYEVVTKDGTFKGGGYAEVSVTCPNGKKVLSGTTQFKLNGTVWPTADTWYEEIIDGGSTYHASADGDTQVGGPDEYQAHVVCAFVG